jgi:hypothetical protein
MFTDTNGATIFDGFAQYTPEWWAIRRGVPTASEFASILTPAGAEPKFSCFADTGETCGVKHGNKETAAGCKKLKAKTDVRELPPELAGGSDSYIARLIADALSPEYGQNEEFENFAMRRGTRIEPQARRFAELDTGNAIKQVGFVKSACGRWGCSPDGLIGDDETLELKCLMPHSHAQAVLEGVVPAEYVPQVHGSLIVTGRKRCRFICFCPWEGPQLHLVVERDGYTTKLQEAMEQFWVKFQKALAKIKGV